MPGEVLTAPHAFVDPQALLYRKLSWRLVPLLFAAYVAAYLDRVNVGFAKLQMLHALGFSETVYGLGAGVFFFGYFAAGVPSNVVLQRVGARVWIASVMLFWAAISASMVFVHSPLTFYGLRFLLGAAEAGLFPGLMLYLTYWFPAARRGAIIAMFMTGIPIAGVIGGPVSGWILSYMPGAHGLAGWQWMFLLEAVPSLLLGAVVLLCLDDGINSARWLDDGEKEMLRRDMARDDAGAVAQTLRDGFTNRWVWALCGIYFFFIMGLYGVGFWLPTLIRGAGVADPFTIGLLTVLPYATAALGMVVCGRLSDAAHERRWHIVVPGVFGAAGWVVSVLFSQNVLVSELALTVATTGVLVTLAQFWCLPTALLAGAAAASGLAVINSLGNLAGFVSPYLIGWIIDTTRSTSLGVCTLAGCLLVGSLLALAMPARLVNR